MSRPDPVIALADRLVPIGVAVVRAGLGESPSTAGLSWKTWCPSGDDHDDGGTDRALKIYPENNSGWCFDCLKRWTPVSLYAAQRGITPIEAARLLLDAIGYRPRPRTLEAALSPPVPAVNRAALADGLRQWARGRIPSWDAKELHSTPFYRILAVLDGVDTPEAADAWFTGAVSVLSAFYLQKEFSNVHA
jgi:hypothetical protein